MIIAQAKFANQTGTAPGTSTIYMPHPTMSDMRGLRGLGVINETDRWRTGDPYGLPGTSVVRLNQRGSSDGLVGSGLGIIPGEINRSLTGAGLGAIPTDAELSRVFQYTPVHSGWVRNGDKLQPPLAGAGLGLFEEQEKRAKQLAAAGMIAAGSLAILAIAAIVQLVRGRQPTHAASLPPFIPPTARGSMARGTSR